MSYSEKNEPTRPIRSPEIKSEIAANIGLNCPQPGAENRRLRPSWRTNWDSNLRYGSENVFEISTVVRWCPAKWPVKKITTRCKNFGLHPLSPVRFFKCPHAMGERVYRHHHSQRKPLAKARSEKRPPLNVETARNSLSLNGQLAQLQSLTGGSVGTIESVMFSAVISETYWRTRGDSNSR